MRTAPEKLAIIRLVEDSEWSVRRPLPEIKVSRSSFYRWYVAYPQDGLEGLGNQSRTSRRHWNRRPDSVRARIVDIALEHPDLTPRELAWHIPDRNDYLVSESSGYRMLQALELITSGQFTVMSASDSCQHPTHRVNELWQADCTYFRVVGWGWYLLSTVMDDYSGYIISWRLTPTMAATEVTDTLQDALMVTGRSAARVRHQPRLLSDHGPCDLSGALQPWLKRRDMEPYPRAAPLITHRPRASLSAISIG